MADQEQDSVHPPFHREGDALVFETPPDPKEASRQRRENEQHEFARSQVETNKTLAWFTGALVVATFCTIGVGVWQAVISRTAANAARDAVKVARDTLTTTQQSNAQQRLDNASAAVAAKTVADRNSVQATKSLQATIDNFRQEQRAWLSPTGPNNKGDYFTVSFSNTGRTPAKDVRIFRDSTQDIAMIPEFDQEPTTGPRAVISPGVISGTEIVPTAGQVAQTETYGKGVFLYGTVWYSDVFKVRHWSQFCYEVLEDQQRRFDFQPCDSHNEIDQNP